MSRPRWIWRCKYQIPSQPGAGRQLRHEVLCQLQEHLWLEHDIFSIHLALEEALVNAIEHGNRSDPAKQVRVCCRMSPELVRIVVGDEGQGSTARACRTQPTRNIAAVPTAEGSC